MRIKPTTLTKLFLALTMLTSGCKKKDTPAPAIEKAEPVVIVPPVQTALLPVKLTSDRLAINLKYLPKTNCLAEVQASDGTREVYLYTDKNQLKEYDRYKNDKKVYTVYYLKDNDGKVIQANQNKVDADGQVLTPTGTYKITYNPELGISTIGWYDNSKQLTIERTWSYSTQGVLIKILSSGETMQTVNYTFDNKNGIFRNVEFTQILSIESLDPLFLSLHGNIISASEEKTNGVNLTYTYEYNSDNYPVTMTSKDSKGQKNTFKITYQ